MQITKIKQLRDDIKSELQTYATEASAEVEKYSEEILIGITVLDDQFRYSQNLAEKTPDKTLLEEFNQAFCFSGVRLESDFRIATKLS